jgi:hypothetical protein
MESKAGLTSLGLIFAGLIVATVYVALQYGVCPLFVILNGAEFIVAALFGTALGNYQGKRA